MTIGFHNPHPPEDYDHNFPLTKVARARALRKALKELQIAWITPGQNFEAINEANRKLRRLLVTRIK